MTLHTLFFKGNEGGAQNPISGGASPWTGLGCQAAAVYGEGLVQSAAAKDVHGKPNTTHFNLFSGDCKSGENGKSQLLAASSVVPAANVDHRGHLELGFEQSLISGKHAYPDQCYGVYSSYGPQFAGRMMVPLGLSSDGGPIFVNAKQYNGIMRRRKKRAEAQAQAQAQAHLHNNFLKIRKPYLHLSRHLHAKRRPRGIGGRFLNTKSSNEEERVPAKKMGRESSSPAGSEVSSDDADAAFSSNANANAALHLFHLHHSFHNPFPGNYLKV